MSSLLQAPRRGVPTLGWDLVYAVDIGHINARIAAAHPAPRRFSSSYGEEITVEGTLGAWQIVPGGSGHLVFLQIPILDGSMRHADRIQTFQGSVTVSFSLEYLEETDGHTLRIRHGAKNDEPAFQIERVDPGALCGLMARSLVESSLQSWLGEHDEAFTHVFATIQLEAMQTDGAHAWLKPTTISYAYADRPARGDGLLAILAMTNGRPAGHLGQQVMASAIADNQSAAMLISPHLLLDWLIRPALPLAYPGTKVEDFEFVGDFPMLQLKAPRALTIEHDDKLPAAPTLQSLTISFTGNQFVCVSETSVSDGTITEHRRVHSRQVLRMQTDAQGKRGIAFVQDGEAEVHAWTTVNPEAQAAANKAAEWVFTVGIVVSLMVTGPIAITVMAVAAVTSGLIKIAPVLAALAHEYLAKPYSQNVDLLALNAFQPFAWHGGADFALESVDLAESLRISGSPWPAGAPA